MIFEVDTTSDVPLWLQLRKRLVHLIHEGYYQPGDQLPTVRGLAAELSINYNTVNKAYLSMTHDGIIISERGRGVFVSADIDDSDEQMAEAQKLLDDLVEQLRAQGLSSWEIRKLLSRRLQQRDLAHEEQEAGEDVARGTMRREARSGARGAQAAQSGEWGAQTAELNKEGARERKAV